jgi:pilus assembly protein FimV
MNQPKWRTTTLALATVVLLGVWASDAAALALGRVNVQSALGEPLRADIEIVEINADEAGSLRTTLASPEAFRAAGLEYNPALSGIEISLQRRPDGRYFLQLSSQRPMNDPFVDLILETQWASGRIVRDYTLLFDPANLRQSAPPPAAAQVAPVTPQARTRPGPVAPAPAARASQQGPATSAAPAREATVKADGTQVKVQSGDTAGKIAAANKPVNVSLDQMLVALLNANPEAFIGGNVNRLKAGAVLEIPSAEEAGQESAAAARQTIIAQSRDFNDFRRRLAEGLPTTKIAAADRQASGKVEAQVQEKKPAAPSPDKLTLSKGAVQGKAVEDKIAREREAKDAAVRLAELNKNISDLNRLGTTAPAVAAAASGGKPAVGATAPAASASATRPAVSVAAIAVPATVSAATSPVAAPAPAPAPAASVPSSPAVAMPASAPVTAAAVAPAAATAAAPAASGPDAAAKPVTSPAIAAKAPSKPIALPVEEPSLIDDLMQNPLVLGVLGLVVALLAAFGFYKVRQRKKATQVDSSFLESRLQPDSFFGASGGQRIDTNEGGATGSSMVYSPSQLDAAGDVDPVAEADVYLAYGRDLQAEEILKEAMRTTPHRVAIHSKLLEIYSKRRDTKAFELVATEAYSLTHGEGPEWEHICELGQELDTGNLLYRPGGQPAEAADSGDEHGGFSSTQATQAAVAEATGPVDLDLDLDFSLGDDVPEPPSAPEPTLKTALQTEPTKNLNMDFGATAVSPVVAPAAISLDLSGVETTGKIEPITAALPDLELADQGLTFTTEPIAAPALPAAAPAPAATADSGMIEFDLGALSLDLPNTAEPATASGKAVAPQEPPSTAAEAGSTGGFEESGSGDPLATKFALAQEFNAIGDPDGARSLAEEVLAEASGDLKHRAQRFLAEIG